ncbi:MAG: membrane integrity-associated transporter subunit PqiC [Deltaproteobacteria bacterium]|nr:membrane integrity-associated transporter subunit PqiC [Deltaproteobacteria bacterium]
MNHNLWRRLRNSLLFALAGGILLTGCVRSVPAQYYQLSALRGDTVRAEFGVSKEATIGLGPVLLPEYLERPQIVSRTSANRLILSTRHRWVEPLAENMPRVLGEDLSALLGTDRILLHPWTRGRRIDCQIIVEVLQFEEAPDGTVQLMARWQVVGKEGQVLVAERRSSISLTPAAPDQEAVVAALSQAVFRLAREIAPALPGLAGQ